VQVVYAAPSRLHWKVEPVSFEEKEKLAEAPLTVLEVMVVSGAVVSTARVRELEAGEVLPAASAAFAV